MAELRDTVTLHGRISVPYKWTVGETGSRFFATLRDEGRLEATKCGNCQSVYLPPRKWCDTCFVDCDSWVAVADEGEVVAFTIVRQAGQLSPAEVPFAYVTVRMDAVTTAMLAVLRDRVDEVRPGSRVRAVYRPQRTGDMADISHFELVD